MKKKFSRILGTSLAITMLVSLMITALPASAGTLTWSPESGMPSTSETSNQLVANADVNDIAVAADGKTIYAISGAGATGANLTFKSLDGGLTWKRLVTGLSVPAFVEVAPDDANVVIVGGDTNKIFTSLDGGTTFSEVTGHGMTNVTCVAISKQSASVRYVAAGGDVSGAAEIKYFKLGSAVPSWTSALTGTDGTTWVDTMIGDVSVKAVAFSPSFVSDKVMVVVTENGTTNALFEIASFSSKKWNANAGFIPSDPTYSYPITVITGANYVPLKAASIAMSPTYVGSDETSRVVSSEPT